MRLSRAILAALAVLLVLTACQRPEMPTVDDMVPAASPDSSALVGAYWYPWYGADGRHWREGYRGTPYLGEYDSADPSVIRQQIAWALDYGVDFFAASWWGRDSFEDRVTSGPFLQALTDSHFRFSILYEAPALLGMVGDRILLDDDAIQQLSSDFGYLATTYFDHPNYLRVDGRPVVFIYLTRAFSGDVLGAITHVREVLAAETGADPFLIGDEVYWQAPLPSRMAPFDGVTAYNMHRSISGIGDNFASRVRARYALWAEAADQHGVAFVPNVIPGFDDTAVRPEAAHPIIPRSAELFSAQLSDALALASGRTRLVMITSWNEWHEDTSIEPSQEFGLEYLELLRDVTTSTMVNVE